MKKMLAGIVVAALLTGCSSMGGEDKFSDPYIKAHIVPHQTTQSQVQQLYGVPDDQTSHSDGSKTWYYRKNGNLSSASSLASYIPGAGAVSSALGMANTASGASSSASSASAKMSGDSTHHGDSLAVYIDNKQMVTGWTL